MAKSVYEMVTDQIVAELEKGNIPWHQPWKGTGEGAISYVSRKEYSFLNQMLLGKPGEYLTFNQVKERKGNVKKGAKSKMVVFFKWIGKDGKDVDLDNDEQRKNAIPLLRFYKVFHLDDTEGIPTKLVKDEEVCTLQPIEKAESVIKDYVGREETLTLTVTKSDSAFYRPSTDEVVVPALSQYKSEDEFYSTTFHELTHSTGKEGRCNRFKEGEKIHFGDCNYSKEELVAEIGSSMICTNLGIDTEKSFKNQCGYIQGWLKALKNDAKLIVSASAKAEKAAKYIMNIQEA